MEQTIEKLTELVNTIARSGDPDDEFYYLGGPMTGIPQFNFPRFHEVGDKLRSEGYNVISPAEIDNPKDRKIAMASVDGLESTLHSERSGGKELLSRDLIVCCLPTCIGGIFIEGWHRSSGAYGESWVLKFLKKEVVEYSELSDGTPVTLPIDRDERMSFLRSVDGGVDGELPYIDDPTWLERAKYGFHEYDDTRDAQKSVAETLRQIGV